MKRETTRRKKQGIDCFDIWGRFMCRAWRENSPYTNYLYYVDQKGRA